MSTLAILEGLKPVTVPRYKIGLSLVLRSYDSAPIVRRYAADRDRLGLWNSEKIFFAAHFRRNDRLLDLGCGAGRTSFGLAKLGWGRITGVDISASMIHSARSAAKKKKCRIIFKVGDARSLPFGNGSFDACLFSFNGLMSIPGTADRIRALREIRRVLRPAGRFVFTTHDRDKAKEFFPFWKAERLRWRRGIQNGSLHEFGDLILRDVDVKGDISYIHIPDRKEILDCLGKAGLRPIEDTWRPEIAEENAAVKQRTAECRFWAAERPAKKR